MKFNLKNLPFKLMNVAWLNLITYFTNVFVLKQNWNLNEILKFNKS